MEKKDAILKKESSEQLEQILGPIFYPISLSFRPNVLTQDEGMVEVVELVINGNNTRCEKQRIVDVSGSSRTDNNGVMTWDLGEVITPCRLDNSGDREKFCDPFSFVATPISDKPVHVTVTRLGLPAFGASCYDNISLKIFTWDANGQPAPNVAFYWRCRVVYMGIIA